MDDDTPAGFTVQPLIGHPLSRTLDILASYAPMSIGARGRLDIYRRWAAAKSFGPDESDICTRWNHRDVFFVSLFENTTFYFVLREKMIHPLEIMFADEYIFVDDVLALYRKLPEQRKIRFLEEQPITQLVEDLDMRCEGDSDARMKLEIILKWMKVVSIGNSGDFHLAFNHREALFMSFFCGATFFYVLRGDTILPLGVIFRDAHKHIVAGTGNMLSLTHLFASRAGQGDE